MLKEFFEQEIVEGPIKNLACDCKDLCQGICDAAK